jgi:sec-independent protein translocase protein TatA
VDIGPTELILIVGVLLLLFGGKKIPDLARGLGQAQREFRKGMSDEPDDAEAPVEAPSDIVVVTADEVVPVADAPAASPTPSTPQ